jgi:hypothetical protein
VPEFTYIATPQISNQTITAYENNTPNGIDFFSNGTFEYGPQRGDLNPQTGRTRSAWINQTNTYIGALYEIRATLINGAELTIVSSENPKFGTWTPLTARKSWYVTAGVANADIQIEIRKITTPATVYTAVYQIRSAGISGGSGSSGGSSFPPGSSPGQQSYV